MQMVAEGTLDLLSEHLYVKDKVSGCSYIAYNQELQYTVLAFSLLSKVIFFFYHCLC